LKNDVWYQVKENDCNNSSQASGFLQQVNLTHQLYMFVVLGFSFFLRNKI